MNELRDELLTLARRTDRAALEAKFDEAVELDPSQLELFLAMGEVMRGNGRLADAAKLVGKLSDHYLEHGDAEQRGRLFRFLVIVNPGERAFRKSLAQALLDLNTDRPAYELFVEAADLLESDPQQALDSLEDMKAFDVGSHVFHSSGWGVGKVDDVDTLGKELVIVFENDRRHSLPVRSALDILRPLNDDDWRVLRAFKKEEMAQLCAEKPGELVARILQQVGRSLDSASFKDLLLEKVIPKGEWTKWWAKARREALKRADVSQEGRGNKLIYQDPADVDVIAEMEEVMTAKQVLDIAEQHLRNLSQEHADDREHLTKVAECLVQGSGKHATKADQSPLEGLLLANDICADNELEVVGVKQAMTMQLFQEELFLDRLSKIRNVRLFKRGLSFLAANKGESYAEILVQLVPLTGSLVLEQVISESLKHDKEGELRALVKQALKKPEEYPEMLAWARRRRYSNTYATLLDGIDANVLLQRCLSLGEAHGKTVRPQLRKLARQVGQELIADDGKQLRQILAHLTPDEGNTLRMFIEGLRGLSDQARWSLLDIVGDVHRPTQGGDEDEDIAVEMDESVIFCTEEGILKRQEEYDHLVNVRLPEIFDAIGKAASFGDLSENAEYTAALEERATQTRKAEDMKDELAKAQKIDRELLREGKVSIGARVTVYDHEADSEETYTMLGPWDADIDRGLLDYRAPLAQALMGYGVGAKIETDIGGRKRHYEVRSVEEAI